MLACSAALGTSGRGHRPKGDALTIFFLVLRNACQRPDISKFRNILFPYWKLGYNSRILSPTYDLGMLCFISGKNILFHKIVGLTEGKQVHAFLTYLITISRAEQTTCFIFISFIFNSSKVNAQFYFMICDPSL